MIRAGNVVIARTALGRDERVVLAGHLDTVPLAAVPNLPTSLVGPDVYGRGTCDMKGGVAVQLRLAATLSTEPERQTRDVTYFFYDGEEVESVRNGLGVIGADPAPAARRRLRRPARAVERHGRGRLQRHDAGRRHRARPGRPQRPGLDGAQRDPRGGRDPRPGSRRTSPRRSRSRAWSFAKALNAVLISGGVAGNVIPDRCVVTVNYRFAPSTTVEAAFGHLQELFEGFEVELADAAPGARPGLNQPAAQAFVAVVGEPPKPKYGWTDVSRFSALGVPAVNFGPGDPNLAHTDNEHCPTDQIRHCEEVLFGWLTS